jgi:hypothetical protein
MTLALIGSSVSCTGDQRDGESHICTLIGCLSGLTVSFDGRFDPKLTYLFEISEIKPTSEMVPMAGCTLTSPVEGGHQLRCASTGEYVVEDLARFPSDRDIQKIVVNVSASEGPGAPVQIGTQTFEPVYTSTEINGPGCGVCRRATANVTIP